MKNYTYQNTLVSKKQLKQLLSWSFNKYGSIRACFLADELKYLGFKYATQAGISISIEDLRVPSIKNTMLKNANNEILNAEKICLKGKITDVERYQKIIDTWNITSELLKDEVVKYFKKFDPLNPVYIMAFSGARGNLSQVRQLVGMRGLMSDPSGQIMNLPIKKNFREGLTITDYLMSGYGARKGIVDTALKTANSGYLTRRLIDVAQDIIIREKDCLTTHSFLFINNNENFPAISEKILGRLLNKPIWDSHTNELIGEINTQITPNFIRLIKQRKIKKLYIRSPLTCCLYRSICQKCYGWELASENLVDMGEAVGIIAGQSIGEPGTQLTMRTFHTGGIFTSETSRQLITQIDGIVKFSTVLKTSSLRTNRGENVLLTESSGSLSIISNEKKEKIIHIDLPRNTLLFIKNHQYVKKNTLIGQLAVNIKQTKMETKHVVSSVSGEIFMPQIKSKRNLTTGNKLLWILSGQVYQAPMSSFLNFYNDYKINKNSYIFRSKITNQYPGFIHLIKNDNNSFQEVIEIKNNNYSLLDSIIQHLSFPINEKTYVLTLKKVKYLVNLQVYDSKLQINLLKDYDFATLITKNFKTMTGGTPYYNHNIIRRKKAYLTKLICFLNDLQKPSHSSLIWLPEEIYQINCDTSLLLVENNNFVSKNFEIIPDLFSKTAGIVKIFEKKSTIQEISIKSGLIYSIPKNIEIKNLDKKLFYPGEFLLNKIKITQPSLCEIINVGPLFKLLVRPIQIYEISIIESDKITSVKSFYNNLTFTIKSNTRYIYNSGEKIKTNNQLEIVTKSLDLNVRKFSEKAKNIKFEILLDQKKNCVNFCLSEKLYLNHYIPANLKYTNIQSCLLVDNQQFVDSYTTLGYLEVVTEQSLELVKFKTKRKQNKQIFLISNNDCITFEKIKVKEKTVGDFLIDTITTNNTGKVLIENNKLLTIQKGRPYFFPNCRNSDFIETTGLKYKFVSLGCQPLKIFKRKLANINYYDITIGSPYCTMSSEKYEKFDFPKILIKKRGKYYTSGVPIFVREFLIKQKNTRTTQLSNLDQAPWFGYLDYKNKIYKTKRKDILTYSNRLRLDNVFIMFMKNSELVSNTLKGKLDSSVEFASVLLLEHPFRTVSIHSITEDYFEQEVNSVYCQNGEFVENGQTIGLLNFEKEITGDIVQGLPRVEELLEARKKKRISKHTPKNQKKGLLIRKTTIDPSFEFRKLGTTIKENEKTNPHTLLKIYFYYFAKVKALIYRGTSKIKLCQLTNNYEASYKSFKKVQALILNSVQSVYQSQGVTIADKHLEVIIKQMTTKVLITHEGETPLLPREVIDLYHIKYINQIVKTQFKQTACYVPLLLGITKAALNNPSFISAASFQETTRVLTKAAIEGRLDWLRGLKENIIIGHLIPAGTGSKNYKNSFKYLDLSSTYFSKQNSELKNLENF